ncbi:MAG TPA: type VI secretion system baseplate subunit TssK [Herpetosiphonaceae bacterium]
MDDSSRRKVIWSEGLLIGPHHFQQADRYHEHTLDLRVRTLVPFGWGALDLQIDLSTLEQRNALRIERFHGVLPSGAVASIPDVDDVPATRVIPPDRIPLFSGHLDVYLALPVDRPNGQNYRMSGSAASADTRYVPSFVNLVDECSGENEQTIVTAKHHFRLLLGDEDDTQLERIKIAELIRLPDGRVTLNQEYAPPCLVVQASATLSGMVRELTRRLKLMILAVAGARQRGAGDTGLDRLELVSVQASLSGALAVLNHFNQIRQVHPEVVYRSLLQLAGQLQVLLPAAQMLDLPAYDHDDLVGCFGSLIQSIETLLHAVPTPPPGPMIAIDLEPAQSAAGYPVLRTRSPLDERLLAADYALFLVVEVSGEYSDRLHFLSKHLPATVTIAAFHQIDRYIERAYGLRITAEQRPPEAPLHAHTVYFQLEHTGAAWEGIRAERSLAIQIPRAVWQEFKQLDVTLIAIHRQAQQPAG